MAAKPDNTLYLLGKYLGLALLLPSAALAGYLIGAFLARYSGWGWLPAAGIVFGVIAGLVKLFQELARDANRTSREGGR